MAVLYVPCSRMTGSAALEKCRELFRIVKRIIAGEV
jgi:hypothetical protein